jgi:hypothetical protein
MIRLHPTMDSIKRSYRAWLEPTVEPSSEPEPPQDDNASDAGSHQGPMSPWLSDLVRRHVAAQPRQSEPAVGDLVILGPETAPSDADDSLPLVMLLDEKRRNHWFGWLVGAHADYAGSQDLILDRALLADDRDPAPIAAFVQCWNRVHRPIDSPARVLHRLTPEALAAVRELSMAGIEPGVSTAPGRMHLRHTATMSVVTGTPYGRHDPRDEYLLLSRELAAMLTEPLLERDDPEHGDDQPDI